MLAPSIDFRVPISKTFPVTRPTSTTVVTGAASGAVDDPGNPDSTGIVADAGYPTTCVDGPEYPGSTAVVTGTGCLTMPVNGPGKPGC